MKFQEYGYLYKICIMKTTVNTSVYVGKISQDLRPRWRATGNQ